MDVEIFLAFICGGVSGAMLMYMYFWNRTKKYRNVYQEGDQWNHKGTLYILKQPDGEVTKLSMCIELNNENSLSEISKNSQVIFDVEVHDSNVEI